MTANKCAYLLMMAFALQVAQANSVSPISKVLQLLSDMQTKIIAEGEAAHAIYTEFAEMCEERSKNLQFEIKTGKAEVADLRAAIEEQTAVAAALDTKVEELTASLATDDADLAAATKIRAKESADFTAEEKELSEVIDALQRAIGILEREMSKHGASMMQIRNAGSLEKTLQLLVEASTLTSADAKGIQALVQTQQSSDDGEMGAPDPAVYKGQSGGIIDTLGDLLDKAETQLADVRNKETASLHEFEMLKQSLVDQIKYETKELDEAKTGIAASNEKKATAEGDLGVTEKNLDEDKNALASLHHECLTKAQDYEAETKSRGEELTAIATAKKVISESTGGAADLSYGFSQTSFLQRSQSPGFQAVRFLRELAQQQRLPALAQLSVRMDAAIRGSDDPFAKVKGLIQDMLERLQKEAEADATEKAFCDKELAETRAKKDDKTTEIKKLSTKIDQMTSRSAQLKEEVAELQKGLSALAKAQAEMDKIRLEEKEAYAKAKVEMEEGIKGVQLGLKVLRDYYAKSDKAHAADEGGGAGVIGLLEVVQSDFSKGLIEMTSTEEGAQSAYDQQTKENEIEKATKEQDVKYKTEEATGLDKAIAEATSDRAGVQEELDAVLEYLKGMEDRCIAKPESYEQRTARREAELAGLKKALSILESETSFMQKTKRTLRGAK
jgi:DNA repair exonuclease SbcCD ATPase subunit